MLRFHVSVWSRRGRCVSIGDWQLWDWWWDDGMHYQRTYSPKKSFKSEFTKYLDGNLSRQRNKKIVGKADSVQPRRVEIWELSILSRGDQSTPKKWHLGFPFEQTSPNQLKFRFRAFNFIEEIFAHCKVLNRFRPKLEPFLTNTLHSCFLRNLS